MSKLQQAFLKDFENTTVTTQQIYAWYRYNKTRPDRPPYRSEIHELIINPLIFKGLIIRLSKGIYLIKPISTPTEKDASLSSGTASDWDDYIQSKLK